jgi:hypothetical protein
LRGGSVNEPRDKAEKSKIFHLVAPFGENPRVSVGNSKSISPISSHPEGPQHLATAKNTFSRSPRLSFPSTFPSFHRFLRWKTTTIAISSSPRVVYF